MQIRFPNPFLRSNKGNYRAYCGRFPVGGWEWPRVGRRGEYCTGTTEKMGMYRTHHKTCCHSQQQKPLGWIIITHLLIKTERWHEIPRWTLKSQGDERDSPPEKRKVKQIMRLLKDLCRVSPTFPLQDVPQKGLTGYTALHAALKLSIGNS